MQASVDHTKSKQLFVISQSCPLQLFPQLCTGVRGGDDVITHSILLNPLNPLCQFYSTIMAYDTAVVYVWEHQGIIEAFPSL